MNSDGPVSQACSCRRCIFVDPTFLSSSRENLFSGGTRSRRTTIRGCFSCPVYLNVWLPSLCPSDPTTPQHVGPHLACPGILLCQQAVVSSGSLSSNLSTVCSATIVCTRLAQHAAHVFGFASCFSLGLLGSLARSQGTHWLMSPSVVRDK